MKMPSETPDVPAQQSRFPVGRTALLVAPWLLLAGLALRHTGGGSAVAISPLPPSLTAAPTSLPTTTPSTAPVFSQSSDVTEGKVGPWGQMQYVPIVLEMPESYATVAEAVSLHDRWIFAYRSRDESIAMMASCGVTPEQLALLPADAWQAAGSSSTLAPPDSFVLALSPDTRSKLYTQLMADPANELAIDPMWFRVGRVDFRLRSSGLSEASMALLKGLLYPGPDSMLLFNEQSVAVRAISDPEEQARFLKAIERKRSLMARLLLSPRSDTAALAAYWGKGGREANILPLLDSVKYNAMAGVENPGRINIISLLPPFAQQRLYRHAELPLPAGKIPEDCFWTAFNFFNDAPDDRVHEASFIIELLNRDYVKIDKPSELGDVILIADDKGNALHAANFIADDILFTKNGFNGGAPWILSPMRDVIDTYRVKHDPLTIAYFRKRDAAK